MSPILVLQPVIQQESTGCAIAASAAIAGVSYAAAREVAAGLGITATDASLWSSSASIRRLLQALGYKADGPEEPFQSWDQLPDCALLSIKWHEVNGKPFWHWVVFVRAGSQAYVLDSKKSLKKNTRTDFGRMHPKWYIEVIR